MKETVRRAVRTFFQAAAGYIAANLAVAASGIASGSETVKSAVITFAAASVACGIAAVMNLPRGRGKTVGSAKNDGSGDENDGE